MSRGFYIFCLILIPVVILALVVFIIGGECSSGLLDWQNLTGSCRAKFQRLNYNPLLQIGVHIGIFIAIFAIMARSFRVGLPIYLSVLVPLALLVVSIQPGGFLATQIYVGFSDKKSLLIGFLTLLALLLFYPSYGFLFSNAVNNRNKKIANCLVATMFVLSLTSSALAIHFYFSFTNFSAKEFVNQPWSLGGLQVARLRLIFWNVLEFLMPALLLSAVLLQFFSGHVEPDDVGKQSVARRERLLWRAALAAIVLTIVAYFLTDLVAGSGAVFHPNPAFSLLAEPFFLPTTIMYFAVCYFAFDVWERRNKIAIIGLIFALLVPGTWLLEQVRVMSFILDEKSKIKALELHSLGEIPDTLVVPNGLVQNRVYWNVSKLQHLVERRSGGRLKQYDRENGGRTAKNITIEALPERYLLLKANQDTAYLVDPKPNGKLRLSKNLLAYELYLIEGNQEFIIGAHVISNWTWPSTLPLLTSSGWVSYRPHQRVSDTKEMKLFLKETIVAGNS
ncbi:hypothetical protein LP7551_03598 [Roseibium album]|nr:hypothetical protein LP7551_03598 [Roseibium album]